MRLYDHSKGNDELYRVDWWRADLDQAFPLCIAMIIRPFAGPKQRRRGRKTTRNLGGYDG